MPIVGIGVDLVKIARIQALAERWQARFLERVFTDAERQTCFRRAAPYASLAGRFAAKEAVFKALGTGWSGGLRWQDVQILSDPAGRPIVSVHGQADCLMRTAGITGIHLSLSHDAEYAIAQAILTSDPEPGRR